MPIKHGALRQLPKIRRRTLRNKDIRSELKTFVKRARELVVKQQRDAAKQLLPQMMRKFDQAAAKRVIHRNTASRMKSRLMRQLATKPTT